MANKPNPANFTPTVPDFPEIGTFQPIYGKFDLTTYIQGASDYEIMSFLVQCYNATLKGYSEVTQLSKDTVTAYNQLQTWVNTWFDNLDVQKEINDKLQEMYENGSLADAVANSPAITPAVQQYFATTPGQKQVSDAVAQKIEYMAKNGTLGTVIVNTNTVQNTTTDWLNKNVTPKGSAVVVDESLTVKGAAADAQATGLIREQVETYYKTEYDIDNPLVGTVYDGYGWDGNPMTKQAYSYVQSFEAKVTAGVLYTFYLRAGRNWLGVTFVDDSYNQIKTYIKINEPTDYSDYRVKAPVGATKVLVNSMKSGQLAAYKLINRKYRYVLPEYYVSHLYTKLNEINSAICKQTIDDFYGAGYVYITDVHAPSNTWTFLPLIERIKALTNAKTLINCGDNVRALGSVDNLLADLREVMNKTYSVFGKEMMYVLGNHDFIISDSDTWGQNMKTIPLASTYQINLSPLGVTTRKMYYYVDDDVALIRHIIIDFTDVQKKAFVNWLNDAFKTAKENYHFALYMHWNVFEKDGTISDAKYQYLVDWVSAIQGKKPFSKTITCTDGTVTVNEDYTNTTHAVCYFANGHQHLDSMFKVNGVTYFTTDCCANYNDNGVVNRVAGTTTDTAFDVICLNVKLRAVTLVRVGAGANRSFTY